MPKLQVDGRPMVDEVLRLYYTGSDTIKNGSLLCYDHDASTAAKRESLVEKPSLGNLLAGAHAGIVVNAPPSGIVGTGAAAGIPVDVLPIRPGGSAYRNLSVLTDENVGAGEILGFIPGSYFASKGQFPGSSFMISREAIDGSGTNAALINGEVAPIDWLRHQDKFVEVWDHFVDPLAAAAVANAASTQDAWVLTGATATVASATSATTPAAVGGGEAILTGTTTTIAQLIKNGGAYLIGAGQSVFFRARVKIDDISDEDWFWGLSQPATAAVASAATSPNGTDYIGFFIDATANAGRLNINTRKASGTEQTASTGVALVNNTYRDIAFFARNRKTGTAAGDKVIQAWVDGVLTNTLNTAAVAAAFPDTVAIAPVISGITGGCVCTIDRLHARMNL